MERIGNSIKPRYNHRQKNAGPPWIRADSVESSADTTGCYCIVSGSEKYGIERKDRKTPLSFKWKLFERGWAFGTVWPSDDRPHPQDWDSNSTSAHYKYLGKTIQNELIECTSKKILSTIVQEIKKCKYFSLILDCTPYVSHTGQLSVVIITVSLEEEDSQV